MVVVTVRGKNPINMTHAGTLCPLRYSLSRFLISGCNPIEGLKIYPLAIYQEIYTFPIPPKDPKIRASQNFLVPPMQQIMAVIIEIISSNSGCNGSNTCLLDLHFLNLSGGLVRAAGIIWFLARDL